MNMTEDSKKPSAAAAVAAVMQDQNTSSGFCPEPPGKIPRLESPVDRPPYTAPPAVTGVPDPLANILMQLTAVQQQQAKSMDALQQAQETQSRALQSALASLATALSSPNCALPSQQLPAANPPTIVDWSFY